MPKQRQGLACKPSHYVRLQGGAECGGATASTAAAEGPLAAAAASTAAAAGSQDDELAEVRALRQQRYQAAAALGASSSRDGQLADVFELRRPRYEATGAVTEQPAAILQHLAGAQRTRKASNAAPQRAVS